jgi:hypothetical protein
MLKVKFWTSVPATVYNPSDSQHRYFPDPAVIEVVDEAMRAYEYALASELKLTSPSEVLQAIRGLKVGKAPGPVH